MSKPKRAARDPRLWARLKALRPLWLLIFLGLAVHVFLPQLAQLTQLGQVLAAATWWAVALSLAAQVLSYMGSGYVLYSLVLIFKQKLSVARGVVITLAAYSMGLLGGGWVTTGAMTFQWLRGLGVKAEPAGLAGSIPLFLNNVALVVAATLGLVYLLFVHQLSDLQVIAFALVLLVMLLVAAAAFWGAGHRQQLGALIARLNKRLSPRFRRSRRRVAGSLSNFFASWDAMLAGHFYRPVLGAFLNVGFDALTLYFLFLAVGEPVSPGVLLAGYGLPLLLAKMAFMIPGGVGVIESSMAALYTSLGAPSEKSVIVVLAYRIFSFWLPVLLGFPAIAYIRRLLSSGKK